MADPALFIVMGLAGAGRTSVTNHLGDLGWRVVDIPAELVGGVLDLMIETGTAKRVAFSVPDGAVLNRSLPVLRAAQVPVQILFLEASNWSLGKRFATTRRRHPQSLDTDQSLDEAVDRDRAGLAAVRAEADLVLDTSELSLSQLRGFVSNHLAGHNGGGLKLVLSSFGFKYGVPSDATFILDCRFLANPQYVRELSEQTGLDGPVQAYVMRQEATAGFVELVDNLLTFLVHQPVDMLPYLKVAIGCTGGRHRSVAVVQELSSRLKTRGVVIQVCHRDISS